LELLVAVQAFELVCQNATKIATYDTLIMIQVLIQTSTLYFLTEWSKLLAYQNSLIFEALLIKQKPPETGDHNFSSPFSNPVYAQNRFG
jgi:hypothetical protein